MFGQRSVSEGEARAAIEGPNPEVNTLSSAIDSPDAESLDGDLLDGQFGGYFIAYRRRIVGPCFLCGLSLIGSGPVGLYYRDPKDSGYVCEECLCKEAPHLGTLVRALHDLKEAALLLPLNADESYRSVLQIMLAILELDGWYPRLSLGTEQGPGIKFRRRPGRERTIEPMIPCLYEAVTQDRLYLVRVFSATPEEISYIPVATWSRRGYWRAPRCGNYRHVERQTFYERISAAKSFKRRRVPEPPITDGMIYEIRKQRALHLVRVKLAGRRIEIDRVGVEFGAGCYLPSTLEQSMVLSDFRRCQKAAFEWSRKFAQPAGTWRF